MESRLASLLTVLSAAITAIVVAGFAVSPVFALFLGVVSGTAFAAWLAFGRAGAPSHDGVVGPYLIALVLVLVLATCRYLAGVPLLAGPLSPWFAPAFRVDISSWFVLSAVAPVSLMLMGGYWLLKRVPLGGYLAWWTAAYALFDGIAQFALATRFAQARIDVALAGSLLVAAALVAAGVVTAQRLLAPHASLVPAASGRLTARQRNLWTLLFASVVSVYAIALFRSAGLVPLLIVVGSMVGGLVGWRLTTAREPIDPARALPLFLVLLALFYLHVGEESLTAFNQGIAQITGKPWSDDDFTLLIGLLGPIVFFFAAWSLWRRQPLGNFIFWFFVVGMILGEHRKANREAA